MPLIAWDEETKEANVDEVETSVEDNVFVSSMCAITWRRALKHWGNVLPEEAYRRRVVNAHKKVSDALRMPWLVCQFVFQPRASTIF